MYFNFYYSNLFSSIGVLILSGSLLFNLGGHLKNFHPTNFVNLSFSSQKSSTSYCASTKVKQSYNFESSDVKPIIVPPIYLSKLPSECDQLMTVEERKNSFIKCLLPLILKVNQDISKERNKLINLIKQVNSLKKLSFKDKEWLIRLQNKYRQQESNLKQLLIHVDVIPPSLALAQAIEESGWGTSYAARLKRSTFGVTLSTGIKSYNTLLENVEGYMLNLNTNPAYEKMRKIRYNLRKNNLSLCSLKLVTGLVKYSELRNLYLDKLSVHIRKNDLRTLDQSILSI